MTRPAPKVGISVHDSMLVPDAGVRRAMLASIAAAGLDHVTVGDHVSFHGGTGFDGLVTALAALCSNDDLEVIVGVYLLALRHPVTVARQLASISQLAPGRLTLGVGVGGEDRREVSNCGIDPATRGRRLNECLFVLRELATGAPLSTTGEFFTLDEAQILPAPTPAVPLIIGGGGETAIQRTARYGDGWLGIFCSARRFAQTREEILAASLAAGRPAPDWFGLNIWCGLDDEPARARTELGQRMQSLYRLPYEKFQHVTAAGTPEQVAETLAGYATAGATSITVIPAARSVEAGIDAVAEIRTLLAKP